MENYYDFMCQTTSTRMPRLSQPIASHSLHQLLFFPRCPQHILKQDYAHGNDLYIVISMNSSLSFSDCFLNIKHSKYYFNYKFVLDVISLLLWNHVHLCIIKHFLISSNSCKKFEIDRIYIYKLQSFYTLICKYYII